VCTLIVDWKPGSLVVGANRDERVDRPSEPFKHRDGVLCPLDVLGGSWVGVNQWGVFVALTNLDEYRKTDKEKKTRGDLVMRALKRTGAPDAAVSLLSWEDPENYKGCILLIGDTNALYMVVFDGKNSTIKTMNPGLYVSTGWGINTWDIPRCDYIKNKYNGKSSLKDILKYHGSFDVESEVCVHDPEETHQTRSSCIITSENNFSKFNVEHIDTRPCENIEWKKETIDIIS